MPTFQFFKNSKKVDEFSGADPTKLKGNLHFSLSYIYKRQSINTTQAVQVVEAKIVGEEVAMSLDLRALLLQVQLSHLLSKWHQLFLLLHPQLLPILLMRFSYQA
jgi:hypothetical protein